MIRDDISFASVWEKWGETSLPKKSIASFIRFLEEKLGARVVYDASLIPFQSIELADLTLLAKKMLEENIITSYSPVPHMPDEPRVYEWRVKYIGGAENMSGGSSMESERHALAAALAESVERYVWKNKTDYFVSPRLASVAEIAKEGSYLAPETFAGFSEEQRAQKPRLQLRKDNVFLWVRGYSWVAKGQVWIPAQVVSGGRSRIPGKSGEQEPSIISATTNGLATYPNRHNAVLRGALELIERDAYIIMWLNQLSLPRFNLEKLAARRSTLSRLLADCKRYRLEPHAVRLITDAPTYAIMAVLLDTTGHMPRITIGLKAGQDAAATFEKALLEALRVRHGARHSVLAPPTDWDPSRKAKDIGHNDRLLYWTVDDRAKRLDFLIKGLVQDFSEPFENDSEEDHLQRIIDWCRMRGYDITSVSLTSSEGNSTPWHIEMVTMPQLQPMHLSEKFQYLGGGRLTEVPKLFGYDPRREPFSDEPHPFA